MKLRDCCLVFANLGLLMGQSSQPPLKVPDSVILERDIDYGSKYGGKLAMDIARPKGEGPFPGILMIHGGGFRAGQRQSYLPMAIRLAGHGYVAATVSYRLAPQYQFPSPVYDVKAAVRFLRANARRFALDGARMCAMGGSAGGHLALFLGLTGGVAEFEGDGANPEQSSTVSCIVNYYGPSDFTRIYDKGGDAAIVLPQFLGGDVKHAMAEHIKASPLHWISPDDPPVLSIHGTRDPLVPYEQSVWLTERLLAAGVNAELETIAGAGHGFRGADAERAETRAIAWFDRYLHKPAPGRKVIISNHGKGAEILCLDWPSGRVLWRVPNNSGHDVQALPNGHVLFTRDPKGVVVEIDENQKEVWTFSEGLKRPVSAQRLSNGNTVIGDMALGKVIEVSPQGHTVWQYENPDLGENHMRLSRRTPQGTTLIANERLGRIIEVDHAGKIVWTYQMPPLRKPYLAQRLPNGNTLISMAEPGEAVEVDREGKIVHAVGADDRVKMAWTSGVAVLPDGGLFISDYLGKRLLEVNAKGDLVHELRETPWSVASVTVP
ncbi:MAG: alpha/beta hydrolase fold domain-containing protein [Bryobacterales bacterium]|nr:alpha/beta hydrolase fold domain-containing protein [Bryobacterales bacterium]